MPTVLITGANRGLGLELAKHYAANGWQLIVANRTPLTPRDFASLGFDLTELRYDALNDATAADLAQRLRGRPIDVVIMNAATDKGAELAPEALDPAQWEQVMVTNTYAPLHLAALLESNLKLGTGKTLIAMTSICASSRHQGLRRFAYSASKAALNQLWRNLSIDWRDWGCVCVAIACDDLPSTLHGQTGNLPMTERAAAIAEVVAAANAEQSGLVLNVSGEVVPW